MNIIGLDITLVSLSGNPALGLWNQLSKQVKLHDGVDQYTRALTRLVTESAGVQPLFVSIGAGDFLAPWLTRLYTEAEFTSKKKPKISTLVLKRLSYSMLDSLEADGLLERGFRINMEGNIQALRDNPSMKRERVVVEEREWRQMPPFHGYLYGEKLLIGPWMIDGDGHLHVKTPLWETQQRQFQERHATFRDLFEAA